MLSRFYVASTLLNATGHLKGMTIYGTLPRDLEFDIVDHPREKLRHRRRHRRHVEAVAKLR